MYDSDTHFALREIDGLTDASDMLAGVDLKFMIVFSPQDVYTTIIINYNIILCVLLICVYYVRVKSFPGGRTDGVRFLRPEGTDIIKYNINAHNVPTYIYKELRPRVF